MSVWLNGALLPAGAARIDPADRGFLLGDGVFETLLAAGGVLPHAARHLARLRDGAALLGIPVAWDDAALLDGMAAVAARVPAARVAVRATLTRGPGLRGILPPAVVSPTLLITAAPAPAPLPPARVVIATGTRRNEHSPLSRIKSLNYLDSILARAEAAQLAADDAILLNTAGRVAEASAGNVFLVIEGRCVTPPVADGALPGIARALLLEAGTAIEAPLWPDDVWRAEAGFIANSLGCRDIASIDGRAVAKNVRF